MRGQLLWYSAVMLGLAFVALRFGDDRGTRFVAMVAVILSIIALFVSVGWEDRDGTETPYDGA